MSLLFGVVPAEILRGVATYIFIYRLVNKPGQNKKIQVFFIMPRLICQMADGLPGPHEDNKSIFL